MRQLGPVGVVADVGVDGVDEGVVAVGGGISADEFSCAVFESALGGAVRAGYCSAPAMRVSLSSTAVAAR